jgi:hypothetical protein
MIVPQRDRRVTKATSSRTAWNGWQYRVRAPYAKDAALSRRHLSTAGHVKPGRNLRGPPRKAKYSLATDSELVP